MTAHDTFVASDFVTIDGVSLHFEFLHRRRGNSEIIILVHGFGASLQIWRGMASSLPDSIDVLALDLKGFGFSDKIDDDKYSPDDHARLLSAFIAIYSDDYIVTVVGHSYGAGVCTITYLRTLEELEESTVSRLILIDPAIYPQKYPFMVQTMRNPVNRLLTCILSSPEYRTHYSLKKLFAPANYHRITREHIAKYAFFLRIEGAERAIADVSRQLDDTDLETLTDNLNRITIPTLLIWGRQDPIIPVQNAYKIAERIQDASVKIIEDCGHAPHEECPEHTAMLVCNFCRRSVK